MHYLLFYRNFNFQGLKILLRTGIIMRHFESVQTQRPPLQTHTSLQASFIAHMGIFEK